MDEAERERPFPERPCHALPSLLELLLGLLREPNTAHLLLRRVLVGVAVLVGVDPQGGWAGAAGTLAAAATATSKETS